MTPDTLVPELDYIRLRATLELFGKPASELNDDELARAEHQARREHDIETRILSAPEAAGIVISDEQVNRAFAEVRERFPDEAAFLQALDQNNLDEDALRVGLARQCRVNTVLELIESAADAEPITDVDVALYYHNHFDSFQQPERREAYHIVISINEDFPENSPTRARERIERIAARVKQKPKLFGELALKNSECPTAMRDGRIGMVRRGQLFPELDEVLFSLREGEISEVIESEMGFHILLCKAISHPQTISLKKATPHIRRILQDRIKESRRRSWIAALTRPAEGGIHS